MLLRKISGFMFIFIAGFLLMFTILSYSDWKYEEELVHNLSLEVKERCKKDDLNCIVDTAMLYTHMIQDPMMRFFSDKEFTSPKLALTRSSFSNFYFGKGACGAYASFFTRLMLHMGYKTKFVILNVGEREGGHIATVIEYNDMLALVDPLSGHIFRDSAGLLVDIDTVAKYWNSYYKLHLPPNYETQYDYQEGWKYTNWGKLGPISKAFYKTSVYFIGKKRTDTLSVHYYIVRLNKSIVVITTALFILSIMVALRLFRPEVNALLEYLANRKHQGNNGANN